MGEVVSLADQIAKNRKKARLRSETPYCGKCFDETGEINDLIHVPFSDTQGKTYFGHFCLVCESEFK